MRRHLQSILLSLMLVPAAQAQSADQVGDFLTARWFDIEIIVFERLDVLDTNVEEQLTQSKLRLWPNNLLDMAEAGWQAPQLEDDADALSSPWVPAANERCLGYPMWSEADPLHPLLEPQTSFSDASLAAQENSAQTDELDGELLEDGLSEEASTDPVLAEAELTDEVLPPLNAPQLTPTPYLQFLADIAAYEEGLFANSLSWRQDLQMVEYVKSINRQRTLRPVIHRRWRQAVPPRDQPQPIYVQSAVDVDSPLSADGFAKIEGFIEVTVGRYLHFAPTLWYHADTLGAEPLPIPFDTEQGLPPLSGGKYMVLSESRRLRSGDLHYLDHPKLGVIVRIDPVEVPEELAATWESLQAEPATDPAN